VRDLGTLAAGPPYPWVYAGVEVTLPSIGAVPEAAIWWGSEEHSSQCPLTVHTLGAPGPFCPNSGQGGAGRTSKMPTFALAMLAVSRAWEVAQGSA
jgi:hypothetical protein